MILFGRSVVLQIGIAGTVGKSFTDLHVDFKVMMSRNSTPNKASIKLFNPNKFTISLLQQKGVTVRLLVGYQVPKLIFQGEPIKDGVKLTYDGVTRVIEIEAKDGGSAYADTQMNISFATQTDLTTILGLISTKMGLPPGYIKPSTIIIYANGITLNGTAGKILDRLAVSQGCDWYIRDGVLFFVPYNEPSLDGVLSFSSLNGNLVGSPTPKKKGLEVKALLEPSMRPGMLFFVQSELYNGYYIAKNVSFEGNTGYETPFYVTVSGSAR